MVVSVKDLYKDSNIIHKEGDNMDSYSLILKKRLAEEAQYALDDIREELFARKVASGLSPKLVHKEIFGMEEGYTELLHSVEVASRIFYLKTSFELSNNFTADMFKNDLIDVWKTAIGQKSKIVTELIAEKDDGDIVDYTKKEYYVKNVDLRAAASLAKTIETTCGFKEELKKNSNGMQIVLDVSSKDELQQKILEKFNVISNKNKEQSKIIDADIVVEGDDHGEE